jgi:hypothetical protein
MCGGGIALCLGGALLFFPILLLAIIPAGYGCYLYLLWKTTVYTLTSAYIKKSSGIFIPKHTNEVSLRQVLKKNKDVYIPGEIDLGTIRIENANSLYGDLIISNVEKVTAINEAISLLEQGEV